MAPLKFLLVFLLFPSCVLENFNCTQNGCFNLAQAFCNPIDLTTLSFSTLKNGQSLQIIGDHLYLLGDADVGTVVELDLNLNPTGWVGAFTEGGIDRISHPAGVAYREGLPTYIGTILGTTGFLVEMDWELFRQDGNLDRAMIRKIQDTASVSGSRPEYVEFDGKWFLATSDYSSGLEAEVRLMDPLRLATAHYTDDPGVVVHRFKTRPYTQDLYWDDGTLILTQNSSYVRGWRTTKINLQKAVLEESGLGEAEMESNCFDAPGELESFAKLPNGQEVFLTSSSQNNLHFLIHSK